MDLCSHSFYSSSLSLHSFSLSSLYLPILHLLFMIILLLLSLLLVVLHPGLVVLILEEKRVGVKDDPPSSLRRGRGRGSFLGPPSSPGRGRGRGTGPLNFSNCMYSLDNLPPFTGHHPGPTINLHDPNAYNYFSLFFDDQLLQHNS